LRTRHSSSATSVEAKHGLRQLLGDCPRLLERPRLVAGALFLAPLDLGDEPGRCGLGKPARLEVVAHVAAGDGHDLAAQAELLDVLEQHHLHF